MLTVDMCVVIFSYSKPYTRCCMLYCFPVEPLYSDFMYRGKQINNIQWPYIISISGACTGPRKEREGGREGTPS